MVVPLPVKQGMGCHCGHLPLPSVTLPTLSNAPCTHQEVHGSLDEPPAPDAPVLRNVKNEYTSRLINVRDSIMLRCVDS